MIAIDLDTNLTRNRDIKNCRVSGFLSQVALDMSDIKEHLCVLKMEEDIITTADRTDLFQRT